MRFYSCCVDWPPDDVPALSEMVDNATSITRRTFLRHVCRGDLGALERSLGYGRGWLTMAGDYHVSYHRSTLHGRRVYYFCHSAIEYVFTPRAA